MESSILFVVNYDKIVRNDERKGGSGMEKGACGKYV